MWSPTFWKQQLYVPSRHSHTHAHYRTRTRSFPARTPRQSEHSSSSDGTGTDLQWASISSHNPARSAPIQLQSDAGTCRSLMATRPAIVEGISTQNHSPFHRGTTRHIHTDTHSLTHAYCHWTNRKDRQTGPRRTGQHSTAQHSTVEDTYSTGPARLDSTRTRHTTRPGNGFARTGQSSQGFFYFSALLESDSVWAPRPQFSVSAHSPRYPGPSKSQSQSQSEERESHRLILPTRHSHLHLISRCMSNLQPQLAFVSLAGVKSSQPPQHNF